MVPFSSLAPWEQGWAVLGILIYSIITLAIACGLHEDLHIKYPTMNSTLGLQTLAILVSLITAAIWPAFVAIFLAVLAVAIAAGLVALAIFIVAAILAAIFEIIKFVCRPCRDLKLPQSPPDLSKKTKTTGNDDVEATVAYVNQPKQEASMELPAYPSPTAALK